MHFVSFESATRLMKFYKGEGEFWEGGEGLSSEIKGAVWQLSRFVK